MSVAEFNLSVETANLGKSTLTDGSVVELEIEERNQGDILCSNSQGVM